MSIAWLPPPDTTICCSIGGAFESGVGVMCARYVVVFALGDITSSGCCALQNSPDTLLVTWRPMSYSPMVGIAKSIALPSPTGVADTFEPSNSTVHA